MEHLVTLVIVLGPISAVFAAVLGNEKIYGVVDSVLTHIFEE